ncbi:MAG: ADP-ribosylglycohydrolase family protein [Patescibacteria group bacterium]
MPDLLDRYLGTLVGVHVRDSLGAPYETWRPQKIADDIAKRGNLQFFDYKNPWLKDGNGTTLPAGRPTDDSDQTADLAYSLTEFGRLDVDHLRDCLRNSVLHGKSRLWDGKATGAGGTTKRALSFDEAEREIAFNNTIGTNGSLMRCAPTALWFGVGKDHDLNHKYQDCFQKVDAMSAVTHQHSHAIWACRYYTRVLLYVLADEVWQNYRYPTPLIARIVERLGDEHDYPYDPGAWPARGTAEFSLYVALYALKHATSFADGIEIAIRVGGDTDTYAAIAGGLLGARYGYQAIPEAWRKTILGHDVMVGYAKALYEMRLYK